jgi:multiple sugar transport system ATP-binding protein
MSEVRLVNVNKVYPHRVQAVYDFNLTVKDKEFVVLVGPRDVANPRPYE